MFRSGSSNAVIGLAGRAVGLAVFAGLALAAATPAAAATPSGWQKGCAERIVTPGSGDALRVHNCSRQKDCQDLANASGRAVFALGCFGIEPEQASPRTRPTGQE